MEDSDGDFSLIEMALQNCLPSPTIHRALDGEQAITFLQKTTDASRPHLVLLDINVPRLNGFDVLRFIRSQDSIRDIPVVVFTSSGNHQEEVAALAIGAQEFITKPLSLDGMMMVLNEVCTKYL